MASSALQRSKICCDFYFYFACIQLYSILGDEKASGAETGIEVAKWRKDYGSELTADLLMQTRNYHSNSIDVHTILLNVRVMACSQIAQLIFFSQSVSFIVLQWRPHDDLITFYCVIAERRRFWLKLSFGNRNANNSTDVDLSSIANTLICWFIRSATTSNRN